MKGKTLIAIAVAGVFAGSGAAFAGGGYKHHSVQTPMSVSEAGPNDAYHSSSFRESRAIGASSRASGSGSVGFDSSKSSSANADYWRIGSEEASETGASAAAGASGSVGMDVSAVSDGTE